jgi:hypothetical protein
MKDTLNALTRRRQRSPIANVAPHHLNAERRKFRIISAPKAPHRVAAHKKQFNDVPPQKPAAASDKCVHSDK